MNTNVVLEKPSVISKIKYLPAVSILLPVHGALTSKSQLEHRLKLIVEKIELRLTSLFSKEKTASVVSNLKNLIHNLNYNIHKESIVIFVSPVLEKIFYLESEVEERIDIDVFFETGDQVFRKKTVYSISLPEAKSIFEKN